MPERNFGCRVSTDYTYKGYRLAVLENELLRVSVLLDKGGDIVEFQHKPSGTDFLWWTPWGLLKKGVVPASAPKEGFFGDLYHGGWQEIFPWGGAPGRHQDLDQGLHGEVSLLPWEARILLDEPGACELELTVRTYRTPFELKKVLRIEEGKAALFARCEARNHSPERVDAMWGQHPAFGGPFLDEHCRLDLPGAEVVYDHAASMAPRLPEGAKGRWPKVAGVDLSRFPAASPCSMDKLYLTKLKAGWYGLTNAKSKVGFGLAWDLKAWPCLWSWQVNGGFRKAPFWGRTRNWAIEPFSSWPDGLDRAAANGTELRFRPGELKKAWFTAVAFGGRARVRGVGRDGSIR